MKKRHHHAGPGTAARRLLNPPCQPAAPSDHANCQVCVRGGHPGALVSSVLPAGWRPDGAEVISRPARTQTGAVCWALEEQLKSCAEGQLWSLQTAVALLGLPLRQGRSLMSCLVTQPCTTGDVSLAARAGWKGTPGHGGFHPSCLLGPRKNHMSTMRQMGGARISACSCCPPAEQGLRLAGSAEPWRAMAGCPSPGLDPVPLCPEMHVSMGEWHWLWDSF